MEEESLISHILEPFVWQRSWAAVFAALFLNFAFSSAGFSVYIQLSGDTFCIFIALPILIHSYYRVLSPSILFLICLFLGTTLALKKFFRTHY